MALANTPAAELVFSLVDETGSPGKMALSVPYATLASVALASADAMIALVQAISGCAVLGYGLTYSKRELTPPAPTPGSRAERKGAFQLLTNAGKLVTYHVPGILPALVDTSGVIDEDQLAVAAFVADLTIDALWSDSNGVGFQSLQRAYEVFKKTTKRQQPPKRRPD